MAEERFVVASIIEDWRYIVQIVVIINGAILWRKDLSLKSITTQTTGHFITSLHILTYMLNMSSCLLSPKLFTNDSFIKNSLVIPDGCKFLPATSCSL